MAEHHGRRGTNPSVCPYCSEPYGTQDELVEHLTIDGGCPKRHEPKHRAPNRSTGWQWSR